MSPQERLAQLKSGYRARFNNETVLRQKLERAQKSGKTIELTTDEWHLACDLDYEDVCAEQDHWERAPDCCQHCNDSSECSICRAEIELRHGRYIKAEEAFNQRLGKLKLFDDLAYSEVSLYENFCPGNKSGFEKPTHRARGQGVGTYFESSDVVALATIRSSVGFGGEGNNEGFQLRLRLGGEGVRDHISAIQNTCDGGVILTVRGGAELTAVCEALQNVLTKFMGPKTPPPTALPPPPPPPPGDSPIEKSFASAYYAQIGSYPQCQVTVDRYRVDFLLPNKLVVECDGHDYHSTKEQRGADAARDRHLMTLGYRVVRFTGSEIHVNAKKCAEQAIALSK